MYVGKSSRSVSSRLCHIEKSKIGGRVWGKQDTKDTNKTALYEPARRDLHNFKYQHFSSIKDKLYRTKSG